MYIFVFWRSISCILLLIEFASGTALWEPLNGTIDQEIFILLACLLYLVFTFRVTTINDLQTLVVCRFFVGFKGTANLIIVLESNC